MGDFSISLTVKTDETKTEQSILMSSTRNYYGGFFPWEELS